MRIKMNKTRFVAMLLCIIMLMLHMNVFSMAANVTDERHSWDFEDISSTVWYTSDDYSSTYEKGMLIVDTAETGVGGYLTADLSYGIDTSNYSYLIVKARNKGTVEKLTIDYTTTAGSSRVEIPMKSNQTIFSEYAFDLSKESNWTGTLNDLKMFLGTGGKIEIEEIYFTDDYVNFPDKDLDLSSYTDWSGTVKYQNGLLKVNTVSKGSGYFYVQSNENRLAENTLPVSQYRYITLRFTKTEYAQNMKLSLFPLDTGNGAESIRIKKYDTYEDDDYVYKCFDVYTLSESVRTSNYPGGIRAVRIDINTAGEYELSKITISAQALNGEASVEKFGVYPDKYDITDNEENAIVIPYVRMTDGTELTAFDDVMWAVDSVNALPEVQSDRSLKLTGQLNGKIKVTGYFTYNDEIFESSCEINIEGQPERIATRKIKLLTYGNSIQKHAPNASLGWEGNWGMAATSEDKDYVHRLIYYLEQKYGVGNIEWVMGTGAGGFESDTTDYAEDEDLTNALSSLKKESETVQPDIVVVQYGENSHCTSAVAYENALTQFVNTVKAGTPNAIVLITTPFWGGNPKINGAKNTAKKLNIPLAELAPLTTAENQALDHPEWANAVQIHPGDLGMDRIAQEMFKQLNKYLTEKEKTTYSVNQTGVEITSEKTTITEDGEKLQLSARILPVEADQTVNWSSADENIAIVDKNGLVTPKRNGSVIITAESAYDSELRDSVTINISGQSALFKLKYNANTTDTVIDLPQTEEVKGTVSLTGKYPFRETYIFEGWSLTKDGAVVDTIDVVQDTEVYAKWKIADEWTFERDDYKEGFNIINGFNQYVTGGRFKMIATDVNVAAGNVLKIKSPKLNLDSNKYKALEVNIQNTTFNENTEMQVSVKTNFGEFKYSEPVNTTEQKKYTFDLKNLIGTIETFEIIPTNIDCTLYVDSISFVGVETSDTSLYLKNSTPQNNETDVDVHSNIKLYFNDVIDISGAEVKLNDEKVSVYTENQNTTLVLDNDTLEEFTSYTVTATNIRGKSGELCSPISITFRTKQKVNIIFEDDYSSDRLSEYEKESIGAELTEEIYKSYPSALKVSAPKQNYSRLSLSGIQLDVGKVYKISFWYSKPANSTTTRVNIITSDEGSYVHSLTNITTDMQYCEATFTAQYKDTSKNVEGAKIKAPFIRLVSSPDETGAIYIDDYRLEEVPNVVINPESEIISNRRKVQAGKPIEILFTNKIKSLSNVMIETANGTVVDNPTVNINNDSAVIDFGANLKFNTYYQMSGKVVDDSGRESKFELDFTTEEQIEYDSIKLYSDEEEITTVSDVKANDELSLKITNIKNKSLADDISLNIIVSIYHANEMVGAYRKKIDLGKNTTIPLEELNNMSAPISLSNGDEIKVYVWSDITDNGVKSEISKYYSIN